MQFRDQGRHIRWMPQTEHVQILEISVHQQHLLELGGAFCFALDGLRERIVVFSGGQGSALEISKRVLQLLQTVRDQGFLLDLKGG